MKQKTSLREDEKQPIFVYGLHPSRELLRNPDREIDAIFVSENAQGKLAEDLSRFQEKVEVLSPRKLGNLVGADAVHQGVVIKARPLEPAQLSAFANARLLIALDQVTDPHNVGAIMRSAAAFGADGLILTWRNAPAETGVLVKSASGAFEHIPIARVTNLSSGLSVLQKRGFTLVGLAGEADESIEDALSHKGPICIVLGAEGKGLREKTRHTVDHLARIEMSNSITALNVSNAAAVALYLATMRS